MVIPLVRQGQPGETPYPIKLFYTSNMPIILHSALVSNLYFISQILFKRFGGNILVRVRGFACRFLAICSLTNVWILSSCIYGHSITLVYVEPKRYKNSIFLSQFFVSDFFCFPIPQMLGTWRDVDGSGQLIPSSGLVYYISAPTSLLAAAQNPLHTCLYVGFVLTACALFSKTWIEARNLLTR